MESANTLNIGTRFTNGSDNIAWLIIGKNEAKRESDNKIIKLDPSTCCYLIEEDVVKCLNYKEEEVTLTEMESRVIEALKENGEMEDSHSAHPEDISDWTGISMNKIRGVISSLDKKGVAYIDEIITGCGKWLILFEDK